MATKHTKAKVEQTAAAPAIAPTATVTQTQAAVSKADKARAIFTECYAMSPVPQRKDIINRFVAEAGLTKAGAATYLQNMKKKANLVVARTSSSAAVAAISEASAA